MFLLSTAGREIFEGNIEINTNIFDFVDSLNRIRNLQLVEDSPWYYVEIDRVIAARG